jgi:hypothetical protein
MTVPRRFKIELWKVMVSVVVLAGAFAVFGVTSALAMLALITALVLPVLLASPGRRLWVAASVSCLYPLLILCSLYATWFTAWAVLGHRPRSSLDDPKSISPIVRVPFDTTAFLMMGSPLALASCIPRMPAGGLQRERRGGSRPSNTAFEVLMPLFARLLAPFFSWLLVIAIIGGNLFEAGDILRWFID